MVVVVEEEEGEVVFTCENRGGSAQHATRATPTRSSHGPDESLALCHPYLQPLCVSHCSFHPHHPACEEEEEETGSLN